VITIVDYGVGNAQAFISLFKSLGIMAKRANTPESLHGASRLILPGVGHFDHAMQKLNTSGLRPKLEDLVLGLNIPIMGICVGMQMLGEGSEEGMMSGLAWIPGNVKALSNKIQPTQLPMPHMGWNFLQPNPNSILFSKGFDGPPQFYFLHSYYFDARSKSDVAATAHYGINFDAVVSRGHIHGVQCHPEKSHGWGKQLLKNFAEL
jgi:glutamine amidotransferase